MDARPHRRRRMRSRSSPTTRMPATGWADSLAVDDRRRPPHPRLDLARRRPSRSQPSQTRACSTPSPRATGEEFDPEAFIRDSAAPCSSSPPAPGPGTVPRSSRRWWKTSWRPPAASPPAPPAPASTRRCCSRLDEIGNLAPLPSLPTLMAEGGGTGITTLAGIAVARAGAGQVVGAPGRGDLGRLHREDHPRRRLQQPRPPRPLHADRGARRAHRLHHGRRLRLPLQPALRAPDRDPPARPDPDASRSAPPSPCCAPRRRSSPTCAPGPTAPRVPSSKPTAPRSNASSTTPTGTNPNGRELGCTCLTTSGFYDERGGLSRATGASR